MNHFHPDIHWLTDYAAGNLPLSQALCISVHLSFCSQCQGEIEQLNSLGGIMLNKAVSAETFNTQPVDAQNAANQQEQDSHISAATRLKVLDLINSDLTALSAQEAVSANDSSQLDTLGTASNAADKASELPHCLDKLLPHGLDDLQWKKLSTSLSVARLEAGDTKREVALHRIKAGGGVANHDHRGREVTVVLTGSFSDQDGLYLPGDFLVKESGEAHSPMASEDSACVCLSVLEAPVKFTGPLTRMINPFLRIYPAAS